MNSTYALSRTSAKTVKRQGLDEPDAKVVSWQRGGDLVVIEIPGHSYWAGLPPTPRGYMRKQTLVLERVEPARPGYSLGRYRVVVEWRNGDADEIELPPQQ